MTEKKKQEILEAYRDKICKRSKEIDPEFRFTWEALFIGLAIGMGASIEEATDPDLYDEAFVYEGGS
jgi:hypothetical protein